MSLGKGSISRIWSRITGFLRKPVHKRSRTCVPIRVPSLFRQAGENGHGQGK